MQPGKIHENQVQMEALSSVNGRAEGEPVNLERKNVALPSTVVWCVVSSAVRGVGAADRRHGGRGRAADRHQTRLRGDGAHRGHPGHAQRPRSRLFAVPQTAGRRPQRRRLRERSRLHRSGPAAPTLLPF